MGYCAYFCTNNKLMENPFYITGIVPEPYFCDRGKETAWMVRTLENRAHILLTSPRRMGKTQLIRHVFEQPSIKDTYYTFYTDIYPTTSLHEFVLFLSKEIYSMLVPKGKTALDKFLSGLHSLAGSLGYDPFTNTPRFDIKLGDIHSPELTLEEIFDYLENADIRENAVAEGYRAVAASHTVLLRALEIVKTVLSGKLN